MNRCYSIHIDLYQATYVWKHITSVISGLDGDAAKREMVSLAGELQNAIEMLKDEEELEEEMR